MTEKRFKVFVGNNYGIQTCDGEVFIDSIISVGDADVLVDLLNELAEENEQLKQSINQLKIQNSRFMQEVAEYSRKSKELEKENEQLKKENSVFEGKDAKHYQRWINQIKKYVEEDNPDFTYDEDFIIKIALSYTLQSVRNGESLKRFQWDYKELKE